MEIYEVPSLYMQLSGAQEKGSETHDSKEDGGANPSKNRRQVYS
jgi:hypothetical protein